MYWYKNSVTVRSVNITFFLHIPIYCRFLFVYSVIMCVQTSLTYQIKGEIPVYLNIIVSNVLSQRKLFF